MAELLHLRSQVIDIAKMRNHLQRQAANSHAVPLETLDLVRIIRQQMHFADAEVAQDLRPDSVVAQILLEAELKVGLDRIHPLILQRVGFDLVTQADSAALLMQVNDYARLGSENLMDRLIELLAAVASLRAENVAGQAFRMQPHQGGTSAAYVAADQREVLAAVNDITEDNRAQLAFGQHKLRFRHALHQQFVGQPVRYQLADKAQRQAMRLRKLL